MFNYIKQDSTIHQKAQWENKTVQIIEKSGV